MADEGQKRGTDPGDAFRDGVRAVTGILGAFKDAIEQTFNELSDRGDISPERARDAARDAMRRAQESVDDLRTRVDFVTRREFDSLRRDLDEVRAQVERHMNAGVHHSHGAAGGAGTAGASGAASEGGSAGSAGGAAPGTGGTGTGAGGSGLGDGSPAL